MPNPQASASSRLPTRRHRAPPFGQQSLRLGRRRTLPEFDKLAPTIGMPESRCPVAQGAPEAARPQNQLPTTLPACSAMVASTASPSGKTSKSSMASVMMATAGPGGRRGAPAATSAARWRRRSSSRPIPSPPGKRPQDPDEAAISRMMQSTATVRVESRVGFLSWGTIRHGGNDTASYCKAYHCCRAARKDHERKVARIRSRRVHRRRRRHPTHSGDSFGQEKYDRG